MTKLQALIEAHNAAERAKRTPEQQEALDRIAAVFNVKPKMGFAQTMFMASAGGLVTLEAGK